MDAWIPIVLVALGVVAIFIVLVRRIRADRNAPHDIEDDAMRKASSDAAARSERDHWRP
ncbi:hypothetical protein [Agromyces sp. SYSU T00266]|uniref:hypothetical protein n=1 Tax=Agromyces zhanjiangensis TaxID=3158562 RepID=UPI003397EF02